MVAGRPLRLQLEAPAPLPDSPPPSRQQVTIRWHNADTTSTRSATALDVISILGTYGMSERGFPLRQCDMFDQLIEFDGHLRGLWDGDKASIAGKNWTMQAGDARAGSVRAAADLEAHLRNNLGFRHMVEHQLMAKPYGYSASEIVWDRFGPLWAPARFVNVAHRRFMAPSTDRVDVIALRNGDSYENLIELEPGRWIVNRRQDRNPWSSGVMRTCAWWAAFKRWSNRDWQVFGEMFGFPAVIGFHEPGASPATKTALRTELQNLGEEGFALLEDTCEVVLKESMRSGDATSVYPAQWKMYEAQMSKAVAGGTLTNDAGEVGSYAQAATHENRTFILTLAQAAELEETFTRDVAIPFVMWNGYGGAAPPRLKFQIVRELSLLTQAQILQILAGAFGESFSVPWSQIAEVFGWRIPADGEAALKPPAQPAKAPAPVGGTKP